MPNVPDTTSNEHRTLELTVKTPQCGHTVRGRMFVSVSLVILSSRTMSGQHMHRTGQDRGAKRNTELSFNGNLKWNMLRQWIGAKSEGRKETVAHTVFPSIRMFD